MSGEGVLCAFLMQLRRGANGAVFLPRSPTRYKLRHASIKSGDTVQGAHTCAIKTGATVRDYVLQPAWYK